jgi:TRAP-type C4-dicarboxylate transport system permease small subunit
MGVDVILMLLPEQAKRYFRLAISSFLLVVNLLMAYLSFDYTMLSTKVTPVMGMSYFTINSVLIVCFSLMAFHTLRFIKDDLTNHDEPSSTNTQ